MYLCGPIRSGEGGGFGKTLQWLKKRIILFDKSFFQSFELQISAFISEQTFVCELVQLSANVELWSCDKKCLYMCILSSLLCRWKLWDVVESLRKEPVSRPWVKIILSNLCSQGQECIFIPYSIYFIADVKWCTCHVSKSFAYLFPLPQVGDASAMVTGQETGSVRSSSKATRNWSSSEWWVL